MIKSIESNITTINNLSTGNEDVKANVVNIKFSNGKGVKILFDDEGNHLKLDNKGNLIKEG